MIHSVSKTYQVHTSTNGSLIITSRKEVKEADLYSAFIEVPYTQGAASANSKSISNF